MKKLAMMLGSVLLAGALVGCGDKDVSADAEAQGQANAKPVRMGLTAYKFDDNFIALFRQAFQKEADGVGDRVALQMVDSQNDAAKQNEQLDILLEKGIDTLAINLVDPAGVEVVLKKIKEKDLPVVFYNRKPSNEAIQSYAKAYYVGIDPNAQGIAQGKLIEKAWKANPKLDLNGDGVIQYVMLKGEPGHPDAEARTIYSIKTLNEDGIKTEELHLDAAMWDTALAKDKMDAWLSGKNADKIEVVICNNDGMALGAIESMKAFDKKLPVFGVDALPEAISLIDKGEMAGTVLNDAKGQAKATFDVALNLGEGKAPTEGTDINMVDKIVLVPSIGIDKENVAEYK